MSDAPNNLHDSRVNPGANLPLVSLIVRTVNRPYYLVECLESIELQSYPNIQIVLVNDGGPSIRSVVDSVSLTKSLELIELPRNVGRSASGNVGLNAARGEFVGFIDDDDIFYPTHVEVLVDQLLQSRALVAYSDAIQADQVKCPFDDRLYMTTGVKLHYSQDFSLATLLQTNYIPILCPLFSAKLLQPVGVMDGASRSSDATPLRFDTMLDVLEDWDFWIQLALKCEFVHVRQITAEYRIRRDGSNTVGQFQHRWEWSREYIRDKYQHHLSAFLQAAPHSVGVSSGREA